MTTGIKSITIFTASWCGQCSALKKQLDQREIQYNLVDVDTDFGMEVAGNWGIRTLPAAIIDDELFSGLGNILDRVKEV